MSEIEDLKKQLSDEKKKVSVLEQKLATYEKDTSKSGYFAVKRIINLQIAYLQNFSIKDKIGGKPSEDGTYIRSKDMWESLPDMITKLDALKKTLRIGAEEEKEFEKSNGGSFLDQAVTGG